MTYLNSHSSLILTVLQQVSTDRLQRAVTALADGSLTMTLTRQTEAEIRALVEVLMMGRRRISEVAAVQLVWEERP